MISVPKTSNKGSATFKSASMSEKIVLSKVSKPSWPPPRGSVEVSQTTSSITGKVVGISHAPRRMVIVAVISQEGAETGFITTEMFSSLDPVVPVKV